MRDISTLKLNQIDRFIYEDRNQEEEQAAVKYTSRQTGSKFIHLKDMAM